MTEMKSGDSVWALERDECGQVTDVSCWVLIAPFRGHMILSPTVDGKSSVDYILDYEADEFAESGDCDFAVFHAEDCYAKREDAENKACEFGWEE